MKLLGAIITVLLLQLSAVNAEICGELGESKPTEINVRYSNGEVAPKQVYSNSYALIVGASRYQYWPELDAVTGEMHDVAQALVRQGFHVRLVCDPLAHDRHGLPEIKQFINEHREANSRLLIYLSGHGWVDRKDDAGVFAAVDSPINTDDQAGARDKGLSSDDLIRIVRGSSARHIMVVVDSCYSAQIFNMKGPGLNLDAFRLEPSIDDFEALSSPARLFLTAADATERAPSPSIFTAAFVLGLEGHADVNQDGIVRSSELAIWVRHLTANNAGVATTSRSGFIPSQRGTFVEESKGDMVFAYSAEDKNESFNRLSGKGKNFLIADEGKDLDATAKNLQVQTQIVEGWSDKRYKVAYFVKQADEGRVLAALDKDRIPYIATRPVLPPSAATNGLSCFYKNPTEKTPIELIKITARALQRQGIEIKVIARATKLTHDEWQFRIQALHYARAQRYLPLTAEDISQLQECPGSKGYFNGGGGARNHGDF